MERRRWLPFALFAPLVLLTLALAVRQCTRSEPPPSPDVPLEHGVPAPDGSTPELQVERAESVTRHELHVRVRTAAGTPASGATVHALEGPDLGVGSPAEAVDPVDAVLQRGAVAVADAAGELRFRAALPCHIVAQSGDEIGLLRVTAGLLEATPEGAALELQLEARRELVVDTVDAEGRPAGGVTLLLRPVAKDTTSAAVTRSLPKSFHRTSDAAGRLRLSRAFHRGFERPSTALAPRRLLLQVAEPGLTGVQEVVAFGEDLRRYVRVVLPPRAALHVKGLRPGALASFDLRARLEAKGEHLELERPVGADGSILFAHVGLGRALRLGTWHGSWELPALERAGEAVHFDVGSVPHGRVLLTIRKQDGTPYGGELGFLHVSLLPPVGAGCAPGRAYREGDAHVVDHVPIGRELTIVATARTSEPGPASAMARLAGPQADGQDVRTVLRFGDRIDERPAPLREDPLIAAGTWTRDEVLAQQRLRPRWELEAFDAARQRWTRAPIAVRPMRMENDGTFELRGRIRDETKPMPPLRLVLRTPERQGLLPREPVPFELGARDLDLDLRRGGTLAVSVPHAPALAHGLRPVLRSMANRTQQPVLGPDSLPRSAESGLLHYHWRGLVPGPHVLELWLLGDSEPLRTIEGIQITLEPQEEDPRLTAIDLGDRFRMVTLQIAFPARPEQLAQTGGVLVPGGQGTEDQHGYPIDRNGRVELLVSARALRVLPIVPGARFEWFDGIDANRTLSLSPAHRLTITQVGGAVPLPAGLRLTAALVRTASDFPRRGCGLFVGTQQHPAAREIWRHANVDFDEHGVARVELSAPGDYLLSYKLVTEPLRPGRSFLDLTKHWQLTIPPDVATSALEVELERKEIERGIELLR